MLYNNIRKSWGNIYASLAKTKEGKSLLLKVKQRSVKKGIFMYAYINKYYDFLSKKLKVSTDWAEIQKAINEKGYRKRRFYIQSLMEFLETDLEEVEK